MAERAEVWAVGSAYEPYVGRWSRLVAGAFVAWLGMADGAVWLDVGCGTGALSETVLGAASPAAVVGIDPSAGFVAYARERLADRRARFAVADARRLPVADGRVDAVVSGLVLNFVPDPERALREMARVTRQGGQVAAYVWDYAGGMELIRRFWDAAAARDPAAVELDEGRRFGLWQPEPLARLFQDAGLVDVRARPIDVPTRFRDFDDYWTPFLGGQGPAPSYAMALPEPSRVALREDLRARLPIAPDGSIPLTARAWAVAGTAGTSCSRGNMTEGQRMTGRRLPPVAAVVSFIDCINRGDVDGLGKLMTEDHQLIVFDEAPVEGRDANVAGWRGYAQSWPRYVIYPTRITTQGTVVAVLGYTTGSHLELADEDESKLTLIWVADVRDGRLASWRLIEDTAEHRREFALDTPGGRPPAAPGSGAALLRSYIARLNHGVRSGDFTSMLAELTDMLAELTDMLAELTDEVELLRVDEDGHGGASGSYAWSERPDVVAGEVHVTARAGRIARVLVRYGDDWRSRPEG